ncbi:MAG TPA: putative 4-mercaptohistidine N1-methyltransferase [Verrucomicrobiae bacterium]|jgi:putative 4-mercaptohistidine N1-methyltranferase
MKKKPGLAAENYYDSERGASEYLLFHYGAAGLRLPSGCPETPFPARCVSELLDPSLVPPAARALDLGCATGRSSFELARVCQEVIGIDFSKQFIDMAGGLRRRGSLQFKSFEEGELTRTRRAVVPPGIDRRRVAFETGDAMRLRSDLGQFDVVFMANLIDRLAEPMRCLERLPGLLRPGGQLLIASPYTWLAGYTPLENWLGGRLRAGKPVKTFDTLRRVLSPHFKLARRLDVPFLLREHARKYQLGISEASAWVRR